jgi:hypothetical protein
VPTTRDGRLFDIVVHASSALDAGNERPVLVLKDDRGILARILMLAENGDVGVGSAKRLRRRLTPEQYEALLSLPPVAAHRSSVVAFQAALAAEFLPRAQALCARLNTDHPAEFAAIVLRRVGDALQLPGFLDIHKPV